MTFSHSGVIECLSKNHKARRDSERVSTVNPLPQSRCAPTTSLLRIFWEKNLQILRSKDLEVSWNNELLPEGQLNIQVISMMGSGESFHAYKKHIISFPIFENCQVTQKRKNSKLLNHYNLHRYYG